MLALTMLPTHAATTKATPTPTAKPTVSAQASAKATATKKAVVKKKPRKKVSVSPSPKLLGHQRDLKQVVRYLQRFQLRKS
jgi:septal ring-binding cell division protein DamX